MDRAGRFRMSRERRCLCVEKMDVAASSLRDDLSDNGHESLFDPVFHIEDSVGGGSEVCFESKLSESFFVLLFKLSSSDSLAVSLVVLIGFDTVTCQDLLRERVALPLEIGVVEVGSGRGGVGELVHSRDGTDALHSVSDTEDSWVKSSVAVMCVV